VRRSAREWRPPPPWKLFPSPASASRLHRRVYCPPTSFTGICLSPRFLLSIQKSSAGDSPLFGPLDARSLAQGSPLPSKAGGTAAPFFSPVTAVTGQPSAHDAPLRWLRSAGHAKTLRCPPFHLGAARASAPIVPMGCVGALFFV